MPPITRRALKATCAKVSNPRQAEIKDLRIAVHDSLTGTIAEDWPAHALQSTLWIPIPDGCIADHFDPELPLKFAQKPDERID